MRIKKFTLLLLVSVLFMICNMNVFAVDEGGTGSVSLQITAPGSDTGISGVNVNIYQVASVSGSKYVKTGDFSESSFDVEKIDDFTAKQNHAYALQLTSFIKNEGISYTASKTSDKNGNVKFSDVSTGLYLVLENNGADSYFDPFLVTVPQVIEGRYIYDVNANPKMELNIVTTEPAETTTNPVGTTTPDETTTEPSETTATTEPTSSETTTQLTTQPTTNISTTSPSDESTTKPSEKPPLPHTGQVWWPVYVLGAAGLTIFAYGLMKRKDPADE